LSTLRALSFLWDAAFSDKSRRFGRRSPNRGRPLDGLVVGPPDVFPSPILPGRKKVFFSHKRAAASEIFRIAGACANGSRPARLGLPGPALPVVCHRLPLKHKTTPIRGREEAARKPTSLSSDSTSVASLLVHISHRGFPFRGPPGDENFKILRGARTF